MSMLPRRTNEFSNFKKTEKRLSHLPVPISSSSNNRPSRERTPRHRSSSLDRQSHLLNPGFSSAVKQRPTAKRSVSATPLRTPLRSRMIETTSNVLWTCEKERQTDDKRVIQEKAARITEYIEKNFPKQGSFFRNGGLKSMSTKQFETIVIIFMKSIVGNKFTVESHFTEDILKILSQIGYPFTINKSLLKTPTAIHAYNSIVILLDWLLSFTLYQNDESEESKFLIKREGNAVNLDDANRYVSMEKETEGFILWNNSKDDEHENLKRIIADEIIQKTTNYENVLAIEQDKIALMAEINELRLKTVKIENEPEFFELDHEFKSKQTVLSGLQKDYEQKTSQLSSKKNEIQSKIKIRRNLKEDIEELEKRLAKQKMSDEERDVLLVEINRLEQCLDIKKKSVSQLQELGTDNQILMSRLLKQFNETIASFNKYIDKIFLGMEKFNGVWIEDMLLKGDCDVPIKDQLDRIAALINQLKQNNMQENQKYQKKVQNLERELKVAQCQLDMLETRRFEVMRGLQLIQNEFEQFEMQAIKNMEKKSKEMELDQIKLNDIKESYEKLKVEVRHTQDELDNLKIENQQMLREIEENGSRMMQEKYRKLELLEKTMEKFQHAIEEFEINYSPLFENK